MSLALCSSLRQNETNLHTAPQGKPKMKQTFSNVLIFGEITHPSNLPVSHGVQEQGSGGGGGRGSSGDE